MKDSETEKLKAMYDSERISNCYLRLCKETEYVWEPFIKEVTRIVNDITDYIKSIEKDESNV